MLMLRPTWAEIDLEAIQWNVKQFRSLIGSNVKLLIAVKANGYGHGAVPVAKAAIAAGADYLGVSSVEEGVELREAGIVSPVLVLGYIPNQAAEYVVRYDLTQTVYQAHLVEALANAAQKAGKKTKVHIKVDTGMSRIGILTVNAGIELAKQIQSHSHLELEGVFTHFSKADEIDRTYTQQQLERYRAFLAALENEGIHVPIKHVANSAGAIEYPESYMQMVRVGIGAYGCYPSAEVNHDSVKLKQALHLYSKIVRIEEIPPHYKVGYGGTYEFEEPRIIATVPVGYADGYSRLLSNVGTVLVREQRVPVVGRVSMDQMMIDVTDVKDVKLEDQVCLYGRQGDQWISLDEVAAAIGTVSYEIACDLGKRVPRIYRMEQEE